MYSTTSPERGMHRSHKNPGRSIRIRTPSQVQVKFQTDDAKNHNKRTPTIACALEIEKSFDNLWQEGLVQNEALQHQRTQMQSHIQLPERQNLHCKD